MSSDSVGQTPPPRKPAGRVVRDAFAELRLTLVAFVKSPRALWGINVPFIIEGLCYFGGLTILGKFCSENVGLSDVVSGYIYSGVTGGITLAMLLFGGIADRIGVRWSLIISLSAMAVGRVLIALSDTLGLANGLWSPMFMTMAGGLLIMVVFYGLYQPAAYAGVRRYTTPKTAAMGYAVIYALMNLGGFMFGGLSPAVRSTVGDRFPPNGLGAVWWALAVLTVAGAVITMVVITRRTDERAVADVRRKLAAEREAAGQAAPDEPAPRGPQAPLALFITLVVAALAALVGFILASTGDLGGGEAGRDGTLRYGLLALTVALGALATWEFLRHRPAHPFRNLRFVFFISILIPVQTLFAHQWLTLPYYCDRAFPGSPVSTYFEFFTNLNPILIFVLAPIVAGLTARADIYRMMVLGTLVMAAPTFLLTLGPMLPVLLAYILLMSIGEAMWQPRFLQWIAEIAPDGQTGSYMGIGQLPWFLTKVITGLYSGWFVANYIPQPDSGQPQNTEFMWLVYGVIAMISPVALLLAKNWMQKGMGARSI